MKTNGVDAETEVTKRRGYFGMRVRNFILRLHTNTITESDLGTHTMKPVYNGVLRSLISFQGGACLMQAAAEAKHFWRP